MAPDDITAVSEGSGSSRPKQHFANRDWMNNGRDNVYSINVLFVVASGSEAVEPRHHPEHRPGRGRGPGDPRAVLRPGEDVLPQHPVLRRGQERGAEGLPQHDGGFLRLPVVPLSLSAPPPSPLRVSHKPNAASLSALGGGASCRSR